jgi:cellulose synthase/poly-beta-1,6-N-acetylglucosamine synthase-like glycosyltransferase
VLRVRSNNTGRQSLILETMAALLFILAVFYLGYFLLMWIESRNWGYRSIKAGEQVDLSVSVVVPAYNEEKTITKKLENLNEQAYSNMEVIVVNDGSTESTKATVQRFIERASDNFRVRLLNFEERQGKASAINCGWKDCEGDIMVISDADTLLKKDAIQEIVQNFRDPHVGSVTGKLSMINYDENTSTGLEKSYRSIFDILRLGESCIDSTPIFNGPLIALRHDLFEQLKLNTLADDTELALTTREKGYRAIFDPAAEVYASTPRDFKCRTKQKIRRAQGIIQAIIRHRKMIFNSEYGKYGLVVLPCEFFMHIISPILVLLSVAFLAFLFTLYVAQMIPILLFLGAIVLILGIAPFFARILSKNRSVVNPLKVLATFLEHQLFLGLGLLSFMWNRSSAKWEKIRD